jgi:hypothetical protein
MKTLKHVLFVVLGFALVVSVTAGAAAPNKVRDVCVASPTGGGSFNTFVFRQVDPLTNGGAISLLGLYYVTGSRRVSPVHGSAVMGTDGTVRLGFFVHSTAESINDFTVSGVTDANFVGTVNYDNDGDFMTNGTLALGVVDCATVVIP